jgi:pimeloyl-ACP methyl ester carboxylesterase
MSVADRARSAPPATLEALLERYDPDVIDVPGGRARIQLGVAGQGAWDAEIIRDQIRLRGASTEPDAELTADAATWQRIAGDLRGGMKAFRGGKLQIRRSIHLGVGFLAATSGVTEERRLRFDRVSSRAGNLSVLSAGEGDPVVCIHGLGATKASFLPTVNALADSYRVIALDLPGFGESDKPIGAPYNAEWFAKCVLSLLDELEIDRAHLIGNSMGGRVAIEAGMREPERVDKLALLSPALAWLNGRRWAPLLKVVRPELGLVQLAPKQITENIVRRIVPGGQKGWAAVGVDEFLRSYYSARGRAAFYAAARNIYLDEPHGEDGFWTRLAELAPDALFVWGKKDPLVPIAFMRHVEAALPQARHLELEGGHVPQLEAPEHTHKAILDFFGEE